MRKILLVLLFIIAYAWNSYGQLNFIVTFDPNDSAPTAYYDTIPWHRVITIDTINYHHNIWQVGKPQKAVFSSAFSAPNVIVTDTSHPYPPNDTSVFVLNFKDTAYFSGPMHIYAPWGILSFYYLLNMDSGSIAKIEFSPDSGVTWINIYDSAAASYFFPTSPLYIGTGWQFLQIVPLFVGLGAGFSDNDSIQFRFTFISSGDTAAHAGWMMDNFNILYYTPGKVPIIANSDITIFPNPAGAELNILSDSEPIDKVSISNMLGQQLQSAVCSGQSRVTVDISSLPAGIYFVRINNSEVRKFVKE